MGIPLSLIILQQIDTIVNKEAVESFIQNALKYYEQVLDYVIENKEVIRILMLESLKSGKHQNSLFRFMKFMSGNEENPVFKTISDVGRDLMYSNEMVLFKFFFSIIPIVSFAAYYDDFKAVSSLDDNELRKSFLHVYQVITASMISGNDIILHNDGLKT